MEQGKDIILIVEDEIGFQKMMQLYLQNKGYHVITADHGEQALEKLLHYKPQLVILDIEMPGLNGFEVCKEIRKSLMVPIVFTSVRRRLSDKIKSFELGADDYLTKPFDFHELEARIQANIRRYNIQHRKMTNILQYGQLKINLNDYTCRINDRLIDLSPKEMELLIHLAQSPNRVWSHEQLYEHIWEPDASGNINTVKVHISNLRRKLEEHHANPTYIKTVRGFGYLFAE